MTVVRPSEAKHSDYSEVAVAGCNCEGCINLRGHRTTARPLTSNEISVSDRWRRRLLSLAGDITVARMAFNEGSSTHRMLSRSLDSIGEWLVEKPPVAPETNDALDAARYRWLKQTDASQLAAIAWRVPAACTAEVNSDHNVDRIIDAARNATNKESE